MDPIELDPYDAGLLPTPSRVGTDWWHDIIRAMLGDAHDFYVEQVNALGLKPTITLDIGVAMKQLADNPELGTALNEMVMGKVVAGQLDALYREVQLLQDLINSAERRGFDFDGIKMTESHYDALLEARKRVEEGRG